MKVFLKILLSFIGFIIAIIFLIQAIVFLRIKDKCITGFDNLYQTSNVNADLVFIGSSRCLEHFDPLFFNNTFKIKSVNIGVEGHTELTMAIVRLQHYLSCNKNPKFVILSFDPYMLGGSFNDNNNMTHKNDFALHSFWPKKKDLLILNYFKFNIYEKYIPLYSFFKYNLSNYCFNIKESNYIKYGFDRRDEHWDTISKPINYLGKSSFFDDTEIPLIRNKLIELKKICFINKVQLLCIQTPVYKILFNDSTFNKTKYICEDLHIPFIDLQKSNISNNINCFYNLNHMNQFGVNKMNEILSKDTLLNSFLQPIKS